MRTVIFFILIAILFPVSNAFSGFELENPFYFASETDHPSVVNASFFDLRERESFVQITNVFSTNLTLHIQIYNVANLCNENNFFDVYTPNDTHVYNMRDILTNDGNPSGVDLPDGAYGIVFVSSGSPPGQAVSFDFAPIIGNFRILDDSGYEYRTNSTSFIVGIFALIFQENQPATSATFNFSDKDGIILSDIIGISVNFGEEIFASFEAEVDDPVAVFSAVDVDIINNNEVLFSCRDVIFACIDENSPLQEEVIEEANGEVPNGGFMMLRSSASVARLEYGINDAIPHSRGSELLCPGNNINEGVVKLTLENFGEDTASMFGYVGLNNGNGRGSMDSLFFPRIPFVDIS